MDHDVDAPQPTRPAGSGVAGAVIGGALVVAILGGVIGGVIASQPRAATPATPAPWPTTVTPAPDVFASPSPSPVVGPTERPAVGTPGPASPASTPVTPPSATPTLTTQPAPAASGRRPTQVDPQWLDLVTSRTGVPQRALEAYAAATLTLQREKSSCSLGWNTLAAIGQIESQHGSFGGARLGEDGVSSPRIVGPALDGQGFASIPDTDSGALDGDTTWDRAVGPMQFIPSTWRTFGADGNGDGIKDPHNIDDASLAAARYLCARGGMDSAGGWRSAVIGYNRSEEYLAQVARVANDYARKVSG